MPHIYAVALEKGGVGKTSVSVNLAAAFAHVGLRTLLIDLDAQRHASRWLGIDTEQLSVDQSIAGVLLKRRDLAQSAIPTDAGVDVIPAHKEMVSLPDLLSKEMGAGIYLLRAAIHKASQAKAGYQIVVMDLAPARGPVLATALAAATRCISPVQAVDLVLQSLHDMVDTIAQARAFNPSLKGLSVLRNNYTARALLDKVYEDGLVRAYGSMLLQTIIPSRSLIRLASGTQQSVFTAHGADESTVRDAFLRLADELITLDGVPT